MTPIKRFAALLAVALAVACTPAEQRPAKPLGDFALGYNIVVAKNAKAVGPSRKATPEEWEAAIEKEIAARFDKQTGEKLYHIGIGVDAYALAVPGIPIVLSPKSVLAVTVNVWDDTAGRRVNAEPRQFTVFEKASGSTFIGSGLTSSKEEQMQRLAANAALKIEAWLDANKAWFTPEAAAARALLPREDQGGAETAPDEAPATN